MADFGGWMMPIEYPGPTGGVMAEHRAVREHVGIFDVSHLGKISVTGKGAVDFLNSILTNDLDAIKDFGAQYTLLCDRSGGVIDDLIAYRLGADEVFLIPNAANCLEVHSVIASQAPAGIEVVNRHHEFSVMAVQGPRSRELLSLVGLNVSEELGYMGFERVEYLGEQVTICRTGYTGERGYEVVAPVRSAVTVEIWKRLSDSLETLQGATVGLGARDTLRTEMGYALHGHELSREINPLEAGVGWAVAWKKDRFLGREALLGIKESGTIRRSLALRAVDKTIPRSGMDVLRDGVSIGKVTSGTFSPTLRVGIALALLDSGVSVGDTVTIDVRGREGSYEVVKAPFVPSHVR